MLSLTFYLCVAGLALVYYLLPLNKRWWVLLAGSIGFYWNLKGEGRWIFLGTMILSYGLGLGIEKLRALTGTKGRDLWRRLIFAVAVTAAAYPLLITKFGNSIFKRLPPWDSIKQLWRLVSCSFRLENGGWIIPMGLAFYTMQIISYLADIYRGEIRAQRNLFKYALFVSFFPQMTQGPIPRYRQLSPQLLDGHRFNEKSFAEGCLLILWGFFLKMMIADKAAALVNTVFGDSVRYPGCYVFVAGCFYSLQLYTDFLSCVCIAGGVAGLFGIELADNFSRPYLAVSVKDFWRRWHISLSSWLRDYIYIPLGGNRKGTLRKYLNLLAVFAVSGLWHGSGYKYLFWGLLHGCYQIAEELAAPWIERICCLIRLPKENLLRRYVGRVTTFLLVMPGWIIFRADGLRNGLSMIKSMFQVWNPWIFFNDSLFGLGLGWKEWMVLGISVMILVKVSLWQEYKHVCVREWLAGQHILLRWPVYIGAVVVILVYGTYGFGFNAQDFIYGGF